MLSVAACFFSVFSPRTLLSLLLFALPPLRFHRDSAIHKAVLDLVAVALAPAS
jgi:hypothetical protein